MQDIKVAFQGEPGAYSEQAAIQLLGANAKTIGLDSFEKCFQALDTGAVRFACLPIENSLGGSIHANYDLQLRNKFFIVAEHDFRVRHCLMVLPGVKIEDVDKVYSHPQALAQCDGYIRKLGLKPEARYDTAGSAKIIATENLRNRAAIASSLAAEYYSMELLDTGIEDDDNNFTRFILLSKRWLPLSRNVELKTSLVFSLINYPGVLVKALSAFSFRDVSLTKLESRPDKLRLKSRQMIEFTTMDEAKIPSDDFELLHSINNNFAEPDTTLDNELGEQRFQFIFYVDCKGSILDRSVQNALRHLSELATYLRVLGCYPKGGVLTDYVARAFGCPAGMRMIDYTAQQPGGEKVEEGSVAPTRERLKIGIVGFGNFGQFLAKTFVKTGKIYACSRSDYSEVANNLGVGYTRDVESMFKKAGGLDVLVISVSILSFEKVMKNIPKNLLQDVLVVDVLSVKVLPKTVLQVVLPTAADVLCTHPMFGPESGKFSWRSLPLVYEKVRIGATQSGEGFVRADLRCERFLDIFRQAGCRMVDMSCEMHDEAAAGSQFVTHFTGRMLAELKLESTPINTKGFETLLALVDNTCKDSFDLFGALYKCNPNATKQLASLQEAMESLTAQLQGMSSAGQVQVDDSQVDTRVSAFVKRISPSKTAETHAKALELKRQGKDILATLTVGEPDFPPPRPILDAVTEGLENGATRYTPVGGTFELRQAVADYYKRRKSVRFDPNSEVLITHGGKQAIFCAILALCDKGDEVIIPAPYWVSYPDIVRLSNASPVIVDRSPANEYVLLPEELDAAITPQTRMLILCNPCNPTGCAYSPDQLEALAVVLRKPKNAHVFVLCDEIYERLVYDGLEHVSFASLPGMLDRTLIVNGFAKGYAMTGFRLGYLACTNKTIIKAATKLQSQINSCPCSISQYAGVAALERVTDDMVQPLYDELEKKRDTLVADIRHIPHVVCPIPRGAFYVFPDVSFYLGKGAKSRETGKVVNTSTDLCNYLIEEHGLALPPGDAFGGAFGVRLSYAASHEDLKSAVTRLKNGLLGLDV
mmetsp:Transcript_22480/g.35858  ORF Transcript_22480/g.35858 Transcript_22480/m.35858 type:complete len:1045 (+) Transcript_22480:109-3243(+)